ncbi:MAG: HlyC/CorC family transporter [Acidobacteria bacterium]|nr:HlyC/CorC family transporter [Acidobacteriota bacterium]MBI3663759.1 HlyC/CorC family transporter [Acidobacteriota bacterium]
MEIFLYWLAVLALNAGLVVFSYLDRIYRELGRVSTGRVHANLDIFEVEVEPRLGMDRRRAALTFGLLANLWLALVAVVTVRGVNLLVLRDWEALVQLFFLLTIEVLLGVQVIPYLLLARSTGRWLRPLLLTVRMFAGVVWPLRALVEVGASVIRFAEEAPGAQQAQQEGIEQLVEAAEEEGILKREQAHLIEQVVEFTDKRVRDVMTPRPDVVAIPAEASVEQLRRLLVETKFSRIPAYEGSLDQAIGVVYARDILGIPESEAARRGVRELARPAIFVPETKLGSQLLKELQQKNQQMALVIDEYGSVAGLVTVEDLIEEIVGEIGEEDRAQLHGGPDIVREEDGGLLIRGSVPLEKVCELFGVELPSDPSIAGATTIAGLLNSVAGHVPKAGEAIDYDGLRFEVVEANQRKVLRLRARRRAEPAVQATQA